jgi:hypothetical protein
MRHLQNRRRTDFSIAIEQLTTLRQELHLAPGIQEELLFLPLIERSRDTLLERHLRPIAAMPDWRKQRRMWKELREAK